MCTQPSLLAQETSDTLTGITHEKHRRYQYVGDFLNLNISVQGGGSYHSSEVPLIFGTSEYSLKGADAEEQKKLDQQMRIAWTAFAKDLEQESEKLG